MNMKLRSYYNNNNCKIWNYSNCYKIEQLQKYKRTSAIFQFSSTIFHKNIPLPIEQSKHLLAQLKNPVAWGYQTKCFYVLWSHWNLVKYSWEPLEVWHIWLLWLTTHWKKWRIVQFSVFINSGWKLRDRNWTILYVTWTLFLTKQNFLSADFSKRHVACTTPL